MNISVTADTVRKWPRPGRTPTIVAGEVEAVAVATLEAPRRRRTSRGVLAGLMSGRANGLGLLRLLLALCVVVSHSNPLGYGRPDVGSRLFGAQTNLGSLAVVGFFVISGFVITGSGRRLSIGRYAWHRALRILPGMWACITLTAFALAPVLYHWQHGSFAGFGLDQPVKYVEAMWNLSDGGTDISKIIATGMHRGTNHNVAFNGALWSLRYEVLCYIMVGILAAGGVLRSARRLVPLVGASLWVLIVMNLWDAPGWRGAPNEPSTWWQLPLLGGMDTHFVIYLGFAFLLGCTMELYRDRVPVSDLLAVACAAVMALSLLLGGFFVFGLPAFAYLVIWAGVRMPRKLQWVGRRNDYSYGLYIYGFVVEQSLSLLGYARRGRITYVLLAVAITWVLAWFSWHVIEKQAMRLKGWTPRRRADAAASPEGKAPLSPTPSLAYPKTPL